MLFFSPRALRASQSSARARGASTSTIDNAEMQKLKPIQVRNLGYPSNLHKRTLYTKYDSKPDGV
jgi:hypothetical protein